MMGVGGSGIGSIATAAIVGMPAYLNSYIAPPMVAGLMQQGMGSGAGLAFMVAGAVSCIPAMAAIWSLVRKAVFAAYIAFGVIGAIIAGAVFELIV
ncbi:permease [Breoghania sp.]|uniref:permease n=1 Tax=Breoghania sp. TaxID=2065378 RepID=UPI0029CA4728|nr:permease [Breoghania sp.]